MAFNRNSTERGDCKLSLVCDHNSATWEQTAYLRFLVRYELLMTLAEALLPRRQTQAQRVKVYTQLLLSRPYSLSALGLGLG